MVIHILHNFLHRKNPTRGKLCASFFQKEGGPATERPNAAGLPDRLT